MDPVYSDDARQHRRMTSYCRGLNYDMKESSCAQGFTVVCDPKAGTYSLMKFLPEARAETCLMRIFTTNSPDEIRKAVDMACTLDMSNFAADAVETIKPLSFNDRWKFNPRKLEGVAHVAYMGPASSRMYLALFIDGSILEHTPSFLRATEDGADFIRSVGIAYTNGNCWESTSLARRNPVSSDVRSMLKYVYGARNARRFVAANHCEVKLT